MRAIARWTIDRLKLLLTLLALFTGFAGGDVARQAPASPAASAAAIAMVEAAVEARSAQAAHRRLIAAPQRLLAHSIGAVRAVTAAPVLPGLTPRGLRARE